MSKSLIAAGILCLIILGLVYSYAMNPHMTRMNNDGPLYAQPDPVASGGPAFQP